jgi:hypothetical protein
MRLTSGWNAEPYGRRRFFIDLGEEDLARVLLAQGIPVDRAASLTINEAYIVLYCEAEILARAALIRHLEAEGGKETEIAAVVEEIGALRLEQGPVLEQLQRKSRVAAPA